MSATASIESQVIAQRHKKKNKLAGKARINV